LETTIDFIIYDKQLDIEYKPLYSNDLIYHLKNNVKTELKCSEIHGIGTFAIKDIQKGEEIFPPWTGSSKIFAIPVSEFKTFNTEVQNLIGRYFISKGSQDYVFIRMTNGINFVFTNVFFNSSYPDLTKQNMSNAGYALKDIKKGEELLDIYYENL
jgi:hypothetical protein